MSTSVTLRRQTTEPWGFRIHGGVDFNQPLVVLKVNSPSLAEKQGLNPGDVILKIGEHDATKLKHKDAQELIIRGGNELQFQVQKGAFSTWKPGTTGNQTSLKKNVRSKVSGSPSASSSSRPFYIATLTNKAGEEVGKQLVNVQYNTPIGLYSEQNIAETLSAQAEVLKTGAIGVDFKKNEKVYNYEDSEVYKMLKLAEKEEQQSAAQSDASDSLRRMAEGDGSSFARGDDQPIPQQQPNVPPWQHDLMKGSFQHQHQQQQQHQHQRIPTGSGHVTAPTSQISRPTPPAPAPKPAGHFQGVSAPSGPPPGKENTSPNVCSDCERLIVGVFVRLKDNMNLHVECFKCATCGQSLKNIGYFNINGKLYCDVHAKTIAKATAMGSPQQSQQQQQQQQQYSPIGQPSGHNIQISPLAQPAQQTPPLLHQQQSLVEQSLPPPPAGFSPQHQQQQQFQPMMPPQQQQHQFSPSKHPPSFVAPLPYSPIGGSTGGFSHVSPPKFSGSGGMTSSSSYSKSMEMTSSSMISSSMSSSSTSQQQQFSSLTSGGGQVPSNLSQLQTSDPMAQNRVIWPPQQTVETFEHSPAPQQQQQFQPQLPQPTFLGTGGQQQQHQQQQHHQPQQHHAGPPPNIAGISQSMAQGGNLLATMAAGQNQQNQNLGGQNLLMTSQNKFTGSQAVGSMMSQSQQPKGPPNNMASKGKQAPLKSFFPSRGRGVLSKPIGTSSRIAVCGGCQRQIRGPFIDAGNSRFFCPEHFKCANSQSCSRELMEVGFVEEKGQMYCEFCWESYLAPACTKCQKRIKNECLNAIGTQWHPDCLCCAKCGKVFGANNAFYLEDGDPICEKDWNEFFTTKCSSCGFAIEAGDRWVEALGKNYHSQCFACSACKKNLEGQSFFAKGGRPFCKTHAR